MSTAAHVACPLRAGALRAGTLRAGAIRFAAAALLAAAGAAGAAAQVGSSSTLADPVVSFSAPGAYMVTLTVCNAAGCSTVNQQVTVLDPRPAVTSQIVAPAQVYAGQPVFLTGQASGQPALSYSWQVLQGGAQLQSVSGQNLLWSTAGLAPGTYALQLTVTNASGTVTASVPLVVLAAASSHFYTVTPCRALDTRRVGAPLLSGAAPRVFPIAGLCGVPPTARAVAFNVTAVNPTNGGFISVFPGDYPQPFISSINFTAGVNLANFAVLPLSSDGLGNVAASTSMTPGGQVDLLLDVNGYFGP